MLRLPEMPTVRRLLVVVTMTVCGFAMTAPIVVAQSVVAQSKTPIVRTESAPMETGTARSSSPGTTLVVLGVLLAAAIILRRIVQKKFDSTRRSIPRGSIELIGRETIDEELSVRLLRVSGRVLVVGSSPHGLATLAEITDPAEVASLMGQTSATANGPTSLFGGRQSMTSSSMNSPSIVESSPASQSDFIREAAVASRAPVSRPQTSSTSTSRAPTTRAGG